MRIFSLKLNEKQLDKLSDIASDVGLISLASVILPVVLDKFDQTRLLLGGIFTILTWLFSLWLRR